MRIDDADYGYAHIYTLDGTEFICTARGIKYSGMSAEEQKAIAEGAKRLQKDALLKGKNAMKAAADKMRLDEIAYERMQADALRARQIEAEQPLRAETMNIHSTPALEVAAKAAAQPSFVPAPVTEAERGVRLKIDADLCAAAREKARPVETPNQRWDRKRRLEAIKTSGGALSPEEDRWLENYMRTPECDAMKRMDEHFDQKGMLKASA